MAESKSPFNKIKEKLAQMQREAEERDAKRRADKTGFPYASLTTAPINIEALALISQESSQKNKIAIVEIKEKKIAVAVFNPSESGAKEIIEKLKSQGYTPSIFVVSMSGLRQVWNFYRFVPEEKEDITGRVRIEENKLAELKNALTSLENVKRAVQKLNVGAGYTGEILEVILAGALANRASDVHFEPAEGFVKLRFRIDGVLRDVFSEVKKGVYHLLISRMKLLSALKINVQDEPQDGRFSITLPEKEIEIRISVNPSEFGETVVLRILDPDTIKLTLPELGFREDDLDIIKKELKKPNGMILNTGPTGSGKTTTLYTFLRHTHSSEVKTITIEDPIEYHLEGIEQTQVDPEAGYTFVNGLRSLLRQDPDVILIGEIRDLETAEIAMHAALTGHLVFSTLHTNEASGAIPRLVDLGVKPAVLAPAINLIIAQRLTRRLCEKCKIPLKAGDDLKKKIGKFIEGLPGRLNREEFKDFNLFKARGCDECNQTGYKGRIGIFELFLIDEEMGRLIVEESSEAEIKKSALKKGMLTMQQDGILKTLKGVTTLEEVEKITGPLIW